MSTGEGNAGSINASALTSNAGDATREVSKVVGRGASTKQGQRDDGASAGGGKQPSRGKRKAQSEIIMPKALPDALSKTTKKTFEDTKGAKGSLPHAEGSGPTINETDLDPLKQPAKKSIIPNSAPAIQTVGSLSHTRVPAGSLQRMCTFGSHRRYENWTSGYRQQTKGPFTDRMPIRQRRRLR